MTAVRLGIADAQFFTDPRGSQGAIADRLVDEGFLGLRIDVPARVELERRASLPLVIARGVSLRAGSGPSFRDRAVLVATRLPSNQTFVGEAFVRKRSDDSPRRPIPDAPEGVSVALTDTDVRARLPELPWKQGEVVAWVLYRDQASNGARATLAAGPGDPLKEPAVAAFLAGQDPAFPQPIWPPSGARWAPEDGHPPLPAAPGIALAVDRSVTIPLAGEAACTLRASVRVPFRPRYLVRPDPGARQEPLPDLDRARDELSGADERGLREAALRREQQRALGLVWQDVLDPAAVAVVPLTVVAVPADKPGAFVFPLQLPVRAPLDPASPPATLEAHVAVDLLELPFGLGLAGGTSFIYAFTDGLMAGPVQTAVVRERDLRP